MRPHAVAVAAIVSSGCSAPTGDGGAARSTPPAAGAAAPTPASARSATPTAAGTASAPIASAAPVTSEEIRAAQAQLVAEVRRGGVVKDPRVLDLIGGVPRHLFAPELSIFAAYQDRPQPIGHGQTISQPTVVAMMTEALELTGKERVLEIGTGSGYQAAVLAKLARAVFSIEIVAPLGEAARARLARLGYANVEVRIGDGYRGWPEHAPFDRIVVTAAPPDMPTALVEQLAVGGILVAPVGETDRTQRLIRLRKTKSGALEEDLGGVRFVPMVPGRD